MPEINLPTKSGQDSIKEIIGIPNPSTADKTTMMNYIKLIEQKIEASAGTDLSKIVPFKKSGTKETATLETLLTISGKGSLSKAVIMHSSGTAAAELIITLDGVQVYNARLDYNNQCQGIIVESLVASYSGVSNAAIIDGFVMTLTGLQTGDIPYTPAYGANTGRALRLNSPLHFKTSLTIQVKSTASSPGIRYEFMGGIS